MSDKDISMEQAMPVIEAGTVLQGKVTRVEADAAYIELDGYGEGVVPRSHWSAVSGPALPEMAAVGDMVQVSVLGVTEEGTLRLSRKNGVNEATWERLREQSSAEQVRHAKLVTLVKGGLVADVEGLRAFLPASLVDVRFVSDLKPYVGQTEPVILTEVDEAEKKIILSRKRAVELTEAKRRGERMSQFTPGQVVQGTVARFTSFGAFVDVGEIDGLLHVSEMGWSRVERPEDALQIGQSITVKILRIDPENGKLSLSLKEAMSNPWADVLKRYKVGDVISGTVKRLSSFGAFVEVEPGIEGLVHISQIANRRVAEPAEALSIGQSVEAKILDIRPDEERMSLSIRDAQTMPERKKPEQWAEKQVKDPVPSTTLGELFGDLLKDKFK